MSNFLFHSPFSLWPFLVLGIFLMIAGSICKHYCLHEGLKRDSQAEQTIPTILHSILNEILLGVLISHTVILLALWCFQGADVFSVAIGAGFLAIPLGSFGTFSRMLQAIRQLGLGRLETPTIASAIIMAAGHCLFLIGVLIGTIRLYFLYSNP